MDDSVLCAAKTRGAGLPTNRLGWRVYICGRDFDFYSYTAVGYGGEKAAVEAVLEVMGMRDVRVRAVVATVAEVDPLPPP